MKYILAGLLLIFSIIGFADTAQSQPKLYQVNIIVFKHITSDTLNAETWKNVLLTPNIKKALNILKPPTSVQSNRDTNTPTYQLLPKNKFGLKKELRALQSKKDYTILLNISWVQTASNIRSATWIHIYGGQSYDSAGQPINTSSTNIVPTSTSQTDTQQLLDPLSTIVSIPAYWELNGLIRISLYRYFNINAKLYLTEPESIIGGQADEGIVGNFQPIPLRTFTIFQNQRTKLQQLNYLDHPLFGMLIQITKSLKK